MSRTFYIQNTEAPKVMSTEELLDLVGGNFRQFALREDDEELDEVMQNALERIWLHATRAGRHQWAWL